MENIILEEIPDEDFSDIDVPLDDWANDPFNNQDAWDYDPFSPDANIWAALQED